LETKINYSVVFRFDDVINLTTLIGGVDIVANHTFTQDEQHFDQGKKYRISGERALAYTRHRKSDGAFERDGRQRQVMQEIIKKLVKPSGWKYIPRVYKYVNKRMEISANPVKALAVLPAILLKKDGITQKEITGDGKMMNGIYYFIPNEESLEKAKEDFSMDFNLGF
jgi:membrane-bound protein lytR